MVTSIRDQLRHLAEATLRQELPDGLAWIPWHDLPSLRWREDALPVDERIARGWLIAAVLRGAPTPDETMQQHASLFDAMDADTLAEWTLRVWIAHDTTTPLPMTAERVDALRSIAVEGARLATRLGRDGTDAEARLRELMDVEANRPAPSALPYQGLLAVVAACVQGEATQRVLVDARGYCDSWHDQRPARCRALARMVAAIEATYSR